jgi:uncharacterized membrane protein YphA (DoxX/SURF4 family)
MLTEYARAKGVRAPAAAVAMSGAMLLAGGVSILLGLRPKLGAGLISGFLLAVSPLMHAFWSEEDQQQRMAEMVNFTKNMALVGASLFAAAHPEPWDWRPAVGSTSEVLMPLR